MNKNRLYLLPYAVTGKYIYDPLIELLSSDVECTAVELKGHGKRMREKWYNSIDEASDEICSLIEKESKDETISLYGHCIGGIIAYDVYKKLKERNTVKITKLFLGAQGTALKLTVDFDKFAKYYFENNSSILNQGTEEEVNQELLQDLFEFIAPLLQHEFQLVDSYCKNKRFSVEEEMVFINGEDDTYVDIDFAKSLLIDAKEEIKQYIVKGGHFFLNESLEEVTNIIKHELNKIL